MTQRPLLGILLGLIVESAHWFRIRWDFNEAALSRAWHLSAICIGVTAAMIWLEGNRYTTVPSLLSWLPVLLLPIQFIQSFGLKNSIPLNTFSFFAGHRRKRNLRLGLKESVVHFNFGNAYLVIAILASPLGAGAREYYFLPGILILVGWALLSIRIRHRLPLVFALSLAGLFAIAGQQSLTYLSKRMVGRYSGGPEKASLDPNVSRTKIGSLEEIKQTNSILWRLQIPEEDPFPKLLRISAYNRYSDGVWKNHVNPQISKSNDFRDLDALEITKGDAFYLVRPNANKEAIRDSLPRFNLRGAASNKTLLPLPGSTASIRDFELDGIERNTLGTVRIFPQNPVIDGTVLWNDSLSPDGEVWEMDLDVAKIEQPTLETILDEIDLETEPTLGDKLEKLRTWFFENFSYTKYLSVPPPEDNARSHSTAIATFLTTNRRGHCEYFATAATLLLREAGIPARYTIGFVVAENDTPTRRATIRGTHAHAWCRVWDEKAGTWIDLDCTPPGWLGAETARQSSAQWLYDAFLRFREDFFIWRNRPKNQLIAATVISILSLIALVIIGRRLLKSKHVLQTRSQYPLTGSNIRTPLHDLENPATKLLGKRPPGLPYSIWLTGLRPSLPDPGQLDEAISLHQQIRFDPSPPPSNAMEKLKILSEKLLSALVIP